MVDLPPHVHLVTKKRAGKAPSVYVFYTRGRNTREAWPSMRMPEPLTPEFSRAYTVCRDLERAQDGSFLLYGQPLPAKEAKDFWPTAFKLLDAKIRRERHGVKDFTALTEAFEAETNPAWTKLSKSTQRGYRAYAKMVRAAWADDLPAELTAVDAQQAIDTLGDTPATANQFRAYLSRLLAWGIPRGFCTQNTVSATEKVPGGEPWVPWPSWAFETLIAEAPFHLAFIAMSAFFTGQRQGDVIGMLRPRKDGSIAVRAQKTKKTVWIPVHSEYAEWIARAPAGDSLQMHLGARLLPFASADSFRNEWQKLMKREAFKRFRAERIVFHGLRKNAVINLLEVGCTEAQVGSIVNMSEQMVRHYSRDVNVRALAKAGMVLLESKWASVRPEGLGTRTEPELETKG